MLLDSKIIAISWVDQVAGRSAEIVVEKSHNPYNANLKIIFHEVRLFTFSADDALNHLYLDPYNLFKMEDGFYYFSSDPYSVGSEPHEEDEGVIEVARISGYLV